MTINDQQPKQATKINYTELCAQIKSHATSLGFQQTAISDLDLGNASERFKQWLAKNHHGEMEYMARNIDKRNHPEQLVPGTLSIISVRMDYFPESSDAETLLKMPDKAFISRYALGRDYHKVMRKRLQKLADYIQDLCGGLGYRVFVDSAPVLEKEIAQKAGIGWIGKHSNVINQKAGSWFFLGELFVDLPLPADTATDNHCGKCQACIDICPTQAIVEPYVVDARRCISYLTIELRTSIPLEFRKAMGNRIYGCDDCQLVCPWNRFAQLSAEADYQPRHGLDAPQLIDLFNWDEATFLSRLEGSPIRRIGYDCWLRNIAVALGNAPSNEAIINALKARLDYPNPMVQEHIQWALNEHGITV